MGAAAQKQNVESMQPGGGPTIRHLKKGDLLFSEGDHSRAMYFVKSGMIRIFKKKGESQIEIDTIRAGQILGELAFLDGNPRSASGEALTTCELIEISGDTFTQTIQKIPDWLKLLLKTVVTRLRAASTRIRQLEQASSAFDYSNKSGKGGSKHYVYLSTADVMKISTAVLLVAARNGEKTDSGIEIRISLLQRYGNQIMGIPVAKITSFLDVLVQVHCLSINDEGNHIHVTDIDFLEKAITYLNEENLKEESKRHSITNKGFNIMRLIFKNLEKYQPDPTTGRTSVNIAQVAKSEPTATGKDAFRLDDFEEIVKLGYASQLTIKSSDETFSTFDAKQFLSAYRIQRLIKGVEAINEQKNKQ